MFDKLTLQNFKLHANPEITLAPLTLLAGLNSAGKSSAIQALLLLQQNLGRGASHTVLLNGEWIQLGQPSDVHFENATSGELGIKVSGEQGIVELKAELEKDKGLRITQSVNDPYRTTLVTQYLCAERTGPRNSFPMQEDDFQVRNGYLGARGEYTFQYLSGIMGEGKLPNLKLRHPKAEGDGLFHNIEKWMQEISPGVRLEATPLNHAGLAIPSFYYSNTSKYRPIHVGFGLTYSLPIITAILSAREGSMLLIENPEAHLNPQGQTAIARLMAKASENVQIIVESHSDHILNGLCYSIALDGVPANNVVANYFQRHDLSATVHAIRPTPDGRLQHWPEGFFDQQQLVLTEILRAKAGRPS